MRQFQFTRLTLLALAAGCVGASVSAHAGDFLGVSSAGDVHTESSKFRIGATLRQGWDSNVDADSVDEQSSMFTEAALRIDTSMGDARTNLVIGANLGAIYYWDVDDDDDQFAPDLSIDIGLNHSVTPRLLLSLRSYAAYQIEPNFEDSLASTRRSGNYFYSNNVVSATYLWTPRLSSVTRYSFAAVLYDEGYVGNIENRTEQFISQELRLLVLPRTTAVVEYRYGIVDYQDNDANSTTNYVLGGFDQVFTPRLRSSLRGGYEFRDYDTQGNVGSPYGEFTLTYNYAQRSSISWVNRYGFEESNVVGDQSNTSFRSGLRINHSFTGKLMGYLGAFYQHSEYENIGSDSYIDPITGVLTSGGIRDEYWEDLLELNAGLKYQIHRNVSLDLGYTYTTVTSDDDFLEYDRNRVYLGVGVNF